MTPERFARAIAVLNHRQPDLTVVTDQVHKGQNLSAIIRTCDAVGIEALYSVYDAATFRAHTGTTMGTHKWVDTHIYKNIDEPLIELKNQHYQIIAADTSGDTKDYREVDYTKPTAVLLGAEKYGISDAAYPYIDQCVTVPMLGMVESFNVGVACAIILSEARGQREAAGFYKERQMSDEAYNRTLFEWTQPLVAKYCQKHDLPYPALNEDGDIVDLDWRKS
ncbi:MAG: tRNA (guanosine(18)-2'-O)-methyltransferase TrmH [Porticoccaceae bacterium]|jgi:tRNA (guanosine-2'-O-)-methyltransferase|nr:tRNA (guanosine(18)-2'-O)-methyltransferase TrmH [Porticoccaceae bacterium]MBT4164318.1 tRNA (guanosine(18)-2'-O)-methyltransferase TrmH [Porticoccaceae bacterium]MBT5102810.1 tRNA (guanosine(18)-2'-O)-methyltransferase TrmH [Porticoccaceae bacterium]MBT6422028.1 tRNA (guanosine(18)-2'-O)-methyltransferase TrmH [Porticoccaceae bacterium]MBT6799640.1 tRNA (guanosine(18)-2'-O)-methyltransferase TrmH [Porticoccaceae bacterium]